MSTLQEIEAKREELRERCKYMDETYGWDCEDHCVLTDEDGVCALNLSDDECVEEMYERLQKFKVDMVNHPTHYNREGAMETIDEMELIFGTEALMHYCLLNAWKYRARALFKNKEEDLKKSDWYLKKYKSCKEKLYGTEATES